GACAQRWCSAARGCAGTRADRAELLRAVAVVDDDGLDHVIVAAHLNLATTERERGREFALLRLPWRGRPRLNGEPQQEDSLCARLPHTIRVWRTCRMTTRAR